MPAPIWMGTPPPAACNFCGADPTYVPIPGWITVTADGGDDGPLTVTVCPRCRGLLALVAPGLTAAVERIQR